MEARGSVRGGRFVAGFYGEQYARPEAVESLRKVRRMEKKGELVRISAVDPLNLTGTITPGPRVTAVHTRHVLYRDGVPLSEEEAARSWPKPAWRRRARALGRVILSETTLVRRRNVPRESGGEGLTLAAS